ncbi:hypothetical protein K438DRAFT_1947204 [Mycena galopus ATCC 62051]|nr:hypothetical protein K438DRAFT_1947204 [Mycena galopus ATCC 62051]
MFACLLALVVRTSRRPDDGGREGHVRKVPRTLDPYPTDLLGQAFPCFAGGRLYFSRTSSLESRSVYHIWWHDTSNLAPLLAKRVGCTGVANGGFSSKPGIGVVFRGGKIVDNLKRRPKQMVAEKGTGSRLGHRKRGRPSIFGRRRMDEEDDSSGGVRREQNRVAEYLLARARGYSALAPYVPRHVRQPLRNALESFRTIKACERHMCLPQPDYDDLKSTGVLPTDRSLTILSQLPGPRDL